MAGPPNTPPNLADQVARLTEEVDTDRAHRRQASAERAQQTAVVDTWLSKERVVLVAFIIIGIFLFRIRERFDTVDLQALDEVSGVQR